MIRTERLLLRPPVEADRGALVAMLADRPLMRDLLSDADQATANAAIDRHLRGHATGQPAFWVVEHDGTVAGFAGLKPGAEGTPIAGMLEIGWVLAAPFQGRGLATEAARASLGWAWANTDAPAVVAIAAARNAKSHAVMDRIGMVRDPAGDFDHPRFAADDPLRPTLTYRIARPA